MVSILNLITLFLKLSLVIQGQAGVVSDFVGSEDTLHCANKTSHEEVLYADSDWFSGNVTLTRKLEKEERVEVEGEVSFGVSCSCSPGFLELGSGLAGHPAYGNKAIRGSLPPLYDFYHSWKIHLS
ncbi:hypothetical protein [Algoriphagus sp. AK58]|uniref:hypothetical protein n=1 Tax=Algoriphagus sp. AK58 TaxID=1406877 RepID=UPI00164F9870|nr:hypothetical protein [Algoriphagus sp. AK58]MBC6365220.1 hypothetical protein [Algoriphagus sp. AK58]